MLWVLKIIILSLSGLCVFAAIAQAADLSIDLAHERVDISAGFNGAQVVLFGTTDIEDAGIAVLLKGPERTFIVRKKEQTWGAWMNKESLEFRRVPVYYDFALSERNVSLEERALLSQNQVGIDNLPFYAEKEDDPEVIRVFHDALIRRMQLAGAYPLREKQIFFMTPGFFRVSFDLPPNVPTGFYRIEAFAYRGDEIVAGKTKMLQVGQVGFNARVYLHAHNNGFVYGVVAILIAVASGWGAFVFLRRD